MDTITKLVGSYVQLFEECAIRGSGNFNEYLKQLPQSTQVDLLLQLISPYDPGYQNKLIERFKLDRVLARQIATIKKRAAVQSTDNIEQISTIIEELQSKYSFNYPKPILYDNEQIQKEDGKILTSLLPDIDQLDKWANKELKNNQDAIMDFSDLALRSLPEHILLNLKPKNKYRLIRQPNIFYQFSDQFTVEFIRRHFEQQAQQYPGFELQRYLLDRLPDNKFQMLLKVIPKLSETSYINQYIQRKYQNSISQFNTLQANGHQLSINQLTQKRQLLLQLYNQTPLWLQMGQYRIQYGFQILETDVRRQCYDIGFYRDFLHENRCQDGDYGGEQMLGDIFILRFLPSEKKEKILLEYLKGLLKVNNSSDIKQQLGQYLNGQQLEKIHSKIQLLETGNEIQAMQTLTPSQIQQLKQQKSIIILEKTKKKLKPLDPIELNLKIKNITKINIKVYKIDLEKKYLEQMQEIENQVQLDHLKSTYQYQYIIENTNPWTQHYHDIVVEGIDKKRGMWVVVLEGNGIETSATIYKGHINMMHQYSVSGVEITFYDEDGERIEKVEAWIQGKKYQIHQKYFLPYRNKSSQITIIAVVDGFAGLFKFKMSEQIYQLDMGYIYNSQSFLVGNKAKISLYARLSNHTKTACLRLLKDIKITVQLLNNKFITNTLLFENIQFKNNHYLLQFPIQNYLRSMNISIDAKIQLFDGTQQKIKAQKKVQMYLNEEKSGFFDVYLRKVGGQGYRVYIFGKNGEGISNAEVIVKFKPFGRNNTVQFNLRTDKDGSVLLNNLQNQTNQFKTEIHTPSGIKSTQWRFRNPRKQSSLQSQYVFNINQQISLPWPFNTDCQLRKLGKLYQVKLQCKNAIYFTDDSRLIIRNLDPGKYELLISEINKKVQIEIVDWSLCRKDRSVVKVRNQQRLIKIPKTIGDKLCIQQPQIKNQGPTTNIKFLISALPNTKPTKDLQFYLLASNYATSQLPQFFNVDNFTADQKPTHYHYSIRQCRFSNNIRISDQIAYIYNREKQPKFIGNNLEKPRIFVKRLEVSSTAEQEEILADRIICIEQQYGGECFRKMRACRDECQFQQSAYRFLNNRFQISSHNNFLRNPTYIESKQLDSNWEVEFDVPVVYSHFKAILVSNYTAIEKRFDYEYSKIQHKDIRHVGHTETDSDSAWSMSRQVHLLNRGSVLKINKDSFWCTVGLQNIINFAYTKGATIQSWVQQWPSLSHSQKLKIYDDKNCHQLNSYIKFHDPKFFTSVVKPFLANKLTKTFVDLCLLDDDGGLDYLEVDKFIKLNEYEKVLLVLQLINKNRIKQAQSIIEQMQCVWKAVKPSLDYYNQQFERVLLGKSEMIQKPKFSNEQFQRQERQVQRYMREDENEVFDEGQQSQEQIINRASPAFTETLKTKQYTETTYSGLINSQHSKQIIKPSSFWPKICRSFLKGTSQLITQDFIYLQSTLQFMLSMSFLPIKKTPQYSIEPEQALIHIKAKDPFLVFIKQTKKQQVSKKGGIMITQKFFNPDDQYRYEEDGVRVQKQATHFVKRKPYMLQTLVTNMLGNQMESQLFIDIPKGSIPLNTHEYTSIINKKLPSYTTQSFERYFYFPHRGRFPTQSANASHKNQIIVKAQKLKVIEVTEKSPMIPLDSVQNIMKSGNKQLIVDLMENKNIFDCNVFNYEDLLWMLKDQRFYHDVIDVLKRRGLYIERIWAYGLYHKDLPTIKELTVINNPNPNPSIFQYFPYYSRRTHQFLESSKSTIRNRQFRATYYQFLFQLLLTTQPSNINHQLIVLAYYLLLQDRINEAQIVIKKIDDPAKKQYNLQYNYIQCYLDMHKGYPSFSKSRKICEKYIDYPVNTWRKMFEEISKTLKGYDQEENIPAQQNANIYEQKVINQGSQLRLSIPPGTQMIALVYEINLELYFSMAPFNQEHDRTFSLISNKIQKIQAANQFRQQIIQRQQLCCQDCVVEVQSGKSDTPKKKLSVSLWENPKLQVMVKQQQGRLTIFYDNRRYPGSYCKVYKKDGSNQEKFYRDGYSDICGSFSYALADVQGIKQFSILVMTQYGGIIRRVRPPNLAGYYHQTN